MKRCPQCEFIYEDDQSLCDMDGVLLVFDSRKLPNLHALATVSAPLPEKGARRSRMVPAFATLILMLAVASVYYVSTMPNAAQPNFTPATTPANIAEMPAAVPPAGDANQMQVAAPAPSPEAATEAAPEEPAKETPRAAPAATKPAAAKPATTSKPAAPKPAAKKDDSKVESILKKTGNFLKKPFKR